MTIPKLRCVVRFSATVLGVASVAFTCSAQGAATDDAGATAATASKHVWRPLVESLTDNPEVLTKDWASIRTVLPAGCLRDANNGSVSCPPTDGVIRMSVVPGPLGLIHIVLQTPATCDALYEVLSQRFGKGELENGDKCYARWKLGKRVKRGNVNLSPGRKNPGELHLQFGIEQGP